MTDDDLRKLHKQYTDWLAQAIATGDAHLADQYQRMQRRLSGLMSHRSALRERQREKATVIGTRYRPGRGGEV
jgi:hypothetical protein